MTSINKTLAISFAVVVVALLLIIAFLLGRRGTQPSAASAAVPASSAPATENSLLTVKDLRQDMLRYNGKFVRVKALIVDYGDGGVKESSGQAAMFGSKAVLANINSNMWQNLDVSKEPGWIVADHLGDYFSGYDLPADGGGSLLVTPAIPTAHYHDWVEMTGTYNASANTLTLANVSVVGHFTPGSP